MSTTLLVSGEPGIGKSTLIADAIDQAADLTVLRAVGIEAESDLAFAGLLSLLRPILPLVDALPDHQADAIRGALSMSGADTNALAVGAATLALLAAAAEPTGLLIVADDAQWVDEPTIVTLRFALRRLHADRVAALVATRTEGRARWIDMGFDELVLEGLDVEAASELLSARHGIVRAVAGQCHAATAGNPLALLEVGASLDDAQRRGRRTLDTPPFVGRKLTDVLGQRIAVLDPGARMAVLIAALTDRASLGPVLSALASLDIDESALAAAEQAEIIAIEGGEFHFAHPLLRAAAVASVDAATRRRAHRALASSLASRPEDHERYSWHLAAAAAGPDEEAAAALERTAAGARRRGAPSSAATALERASRLSPTEADATRRLIEAGDAYRDASGSRRALECWQEALDATADESTRAAIAGRIGEGRAWFDDIGSAVDFLVAESDRVGRADPANASGLLVRASMMSGLAGSMRRAVQLADVATDLAPDGGFEALAARGARALALVNVGEQHRGSADLATLDSLTASITDPDDSLLPFFQMAAFSQMVREDWTRARATLDTVVRCARNQGMGAVLSFACAVRADVAWRTGRWGDARVDAAVAVSFSEANLPPDASFGHAVLARVEACLGLDGASRENALAANATGGAIRMVTLQMWSDAAIGLLELGRGDGRAAALALGRIATACRAGDIADPGLLWWQADLAEALLATGAVDSARRIHADLVAREQRSGRRWATVAATRIAGLLDPDRGHVHFEASAAAATALEAPFERARSLLCWAEADATRRPDRARHHADTARDIFQSLGADPWSARAGRLLQCCGGRSAQSPPAKKPAAIASRLTGAELRVALAIAAGASSREAAEQLYISVRTIEFHLNSIYRKLQLRSRTELALLVERDRHVGAGDLPTTR